jgi:nitronate monooxygenase
MSSRSARLVPGLDLPIVLAPMAGGPSTVELAAAVSNAGGLGFLASGYRRSEETREEIRLLRRLTDRPFGVNLFVPGVADIDEAAVERYLARLGVEAERYGVQPGRARYDDDEWQEKLAMVCEERPAVVSFVFGCPAPRELDVLRAAGIAVWVTITDPAEAAVAQEAGADALVVQGVEAGGHRGGLTDSGDGFGLLSLLRLTASACDLPLIAAGGIGDGQALAAVLCASASAAQIGTAFMLCEEAGTSPAHRRSIASDAPTALTRAFTGRTARGIVNRFMSAHTDEAPVAYPHVHHVTSPIRAAARAREDSDGFNLWAGQAHRLARAEPAGALVRRLVADAQAALRDAESFVAASVRPE